MKAGYPKQSKTTNIKKGSREIFLMYFNIWDCFNIVLVNDDSEVIFIGTLSRHVDILP